MNKIKKAFIKANKEAYKEFREQYPKSEKSIKVTEGIFVDERDGREYRTITLPTGKTWMAENLVYQVEISFIYDNDEANLNKYGRLYTWEAAKIACPNGWRLPTIDELMTLSNDRLKLLPGGYRNSSGSFFSIGSLGGWWSSSANGSADAWGRVLSRDGDGVYRFSNSRISGFSVRCIKE